MIMSGGVGRTERIWGAENFLFLNLGGGYRGLSFIPTCQFVHMCFTYLFLFNFLFWNIYFSTFANVDTQSRYNSIINLNFNNYPHFSIFVAHRHAS